MSFFNKYVSVNKLTEKTIILVKLERNHFRGKTKLMKMSSVVHLEFKHMHCFL